MNAKRLDPGKTGRSPNPRNGPPPGSHRRGDVRLADAIAAAELPRCEFCDGEMEHDPYQPSDPEVGVREAPAAWTCCLCGHTVTEPTLSELKDAADDAAVDAHRMGVIGGGAC